ncbi:MAG: HAMP domain-containing histidine kinase [Actinobacteria bacterium]|nr:HAMP domain-containing histidine kinase [Actinomycetota bacterium]
MPGWFSGIRLRLLASFVLLLALATAASVVAVRVILVHRIDREIDSDLVQVARELHQLSTGNDPETGRPFDGRVRRIFEVFLEGNIPARHEAQISYVGGKPFLRSRDILPYRLDRDPALTERWGSLTDSERGRVDTPGGPVDFLAVPVRSEGETKGVFVTAIFRDLAEEEIAPAIFGAAGVGAVVLLIGSLLAWRIADRILHPVARVSAAARGISESDLRRRIPVEAQDEIGDLTQTFNEMLDRLEHAFSAQRRFIDDAGHELRTPITIIQGQLELLGDDPEERRKTLDIVMDELDRMSRFVSDLLVLVRSERPDFLNLETVDVATLTDELYAKATALGDREWTVDAVGKGRIVADRQRVTQAMMQLAQNAVQYSGEDGAIAIGSELEDGEVRFWVRDTGPGIPPGEQEQIFERFSRGHDGRMRSDGAGLGLSIVKAIAEAHHGRVGVESRPGAGTRFVIALPVDQPEPATEIGS